MIMALAGSMNVLAAVIHRPGSAERSALAAALRGPADQCARRGHSDTGIFLRTNATKACAPTSGVG